MNANERINILDENIDKCIESIDNICTCLEEISVSLQSETRTMEAMLVRIERLEMRL